MGCRTLFHVAKKHGQRAAADPSTDSPPPMGGTGGDDSSLLTDNRHTRGDARLIERAIKRGWPVSDELKAKLVTRLAGVIDDEQATARTVSIAGKVIIDMERQNLEADRLDFARETAGGSDDDVPTVIRTHTGGPGGTPPNPRRVEPAKPKPKPKAAANPPPCGAPKKGPAKKGKPGGGVFTGGA